MGTCEKIGIDSCFLKSRADVQQNIGSISRQEAVWFGPSDLIGVIITNACAFLRSNELYTDVNSWVRSDENAGEMLNVLMQAAVLSPDSVKKFNHIIEAEFEHHVLFMILKRMEFRVFPDTGSMAVRECVANRIIHPDHGIDGVSLGHYQRLLVLSGCSLLFCLSVLGLEFMRNMYR